MRTRRAGEAAALALLLLLTALLGARTLGQGWKDWDDPKIVRENPRLRIRDAEGLLALLLPSGAGGRAVAWQPVRDLSHALDLALFGDRAAGHHAVNLALYVLAAGLAWRLLREFLPPAGALLGAAVFALHPAHVESYAWISGRKDLLSAVFFFSSCLLWLRARPDGGGPLRRIPWGLSLAAALLAFLSKPTTLPLPACIALLEILRAPAGTPFRAYLRRLAPSIPHWAIAGLAGALVLAAGREAGIVKEAAALPTIAALPLVLWRYAGMIVLPVGLCPAYADPAPASPLAPSVLLATATLGAALAGIARAGPLARPLAVSVLWAILLLGPTLGAIPLSTQRADRYLFLPLFGAALLAGSLPGLVSRGRIRGFVSAALGLWCLALGGLTTARIRAWDTDLTLWEDAVRRAPASTVAWTSLGGALEASGRAGEAEGAYRAALEAAPGNEVAWLNLGSILLQRGDVSGAEASFRAALDARPGYLAARASLAGILLRSGDPAATVGAWEDLVADAPGRPDFHYGLGLALWRAGRAEEALAAYAESLRLDPGHVPAGTNRTLALLRLGRSAEAAAAAEDLLDRNPGDADLAILAAVSASATGDPARARAHLDEALRIRPGDPGALDLAARLSREPSSPLPLPPSSR